MPFTTMKNLLVRGFRSQRARFRTPAGAGLAGLLVCCLPSWAASPGPVDPKALAGEVRPFPKPNVVFEYNRGVVMSDGLALRVNVFRPSASGHYPVIVTHGPYGKDVAWQTAEPYLAAWQKITTKIPGLCEDSSCSFMRWEMPDPERWVPAGYILIQADSRGSGKTAGFQDLWTTRNSSNGPRPSPGPTARSACWASPTTPSINGRWPRFNPGGWLPSFHGKVPRTPTGRSRTTAAYRRPCSCLTGTSGKFCPTSMATRRTRSEMQSLADRLSGLQCRPTSSRAVVRRCSTT